MGYFVSAISGSVGFILQMTGKQNVFQVILLSAAVINIALNIVLVPIYGISGASFATMTSMIFWNLTAVIYIRLNYGFTSLYFPLIFKK
jgi:O-antigen/teichoic acid export membrane protein